MKALRDWWFRFWFEPMDPRPLALCRIVFFASMFVLYFTYDFSGYGEVDPVFYEDPLFLLRRMPMDYPIPSAAVLGFLTAVWKISFVTSCLGLMTRVSIWISFVLSFVLILIEDSFGMKIHHWNLVLIFVPGILAFARCDDAWSLDRWIRRARGSDGEPAPYVPSGEYRWPMQMVPFFTACFFIQAGIAKLTTDGFDLVATRNMQNVFLHHYVNFPLEGNWVSGPDAPLFPSVLNFWVGNSAFLSKTTMVGAIMVEVFFPLAVFTRWGRRILAPVAFSMIMSFSVFIGPPHYTFLATGIFWLPWTKILPKIVRNPRVPWPVAP